jgi:predicted HD superfamily hydrolase involved in NAD metabolism
MTVLKKVSHVAFEYSKAQRQTIHTLEDALQSHMAAVKPRRYEHSLSVAKAAEKLASLYGVDPYAARVAGILHDWHKVSTNAELLQKAQDLGIDLGVDASLVVGLLHGIITARELPPHFPDLPHDIWLAIARHTTGASDMTALDMVLFVADGIEPLRRATPGIERTRSMVGKASLDDLYWESFIGGAIYVLETHRYLYPGTLEIYNDHVLSTSRATMPVR